MARKKRKKNKKEPLKKHNRPGLPDTIRDILIGGLFIFLCIFFILSFVNLAGIAGKLVNKGFLHLFGRTTYVFPLCFLAIGIVFLSTKVSHKKSIFISILAFAFSLSGFFGALDSKIFLTEQFGFSVNGGWVGSGMAWPLLKIFGFWVVEAIYLLICFAAIFLVWRFSFFFPKKEAQAEEKPKKDIIVQKQNGAPKLAIKKVFAPSFKTKSVDEPVPVPKIQKQEKTAIQVQPSLIQAPNGSLEGGKLPPLDLLEADKDKATAGDIETSSQIIKRTLENFGINVEMSAISVGPTVTQYTFKPAEGIKLSKITALNNNLALALAAHPIRIEAPIPGKSLVGIEVPNETRAMVRLRDLFADPEGRGSNNSLNFVVGRDVIGNPVFADLSKMPHILVAGSTGTGKTIGLNSILLSLLYNHTPSSLRLILVDPKRVEFSAYNDLPHLLGPVVFDANKVVGVLRWLVGEMEKRFEMLSEVGARNIGFYNAKIEKNGRFKKEGLQRMPSVSYTHLTLPTIYSV